MKYRITVDFNSNGSECSFEDLDCPINNTQTLSTGNSTGLERLRAFVRKIEGDVNYRFPNGT